MAYAFRAVGSDRPLSDTNGLPPIALLPAPVEFPQLLMSAVERELNPSNCADLSDLSDLSDLTDSGDEAQGNPPAQLSRPPTVLTGKNKRHHAKRARQREAARRSLHPNPKAEALRAAAAASSGIPANLETRRLPVAHGAYSAKYDKKPSAETRRELTVVELTGPEFGFELIEWDGMYGPPIAFYWGAENKLTSAPRPLVDPERRIVGVLAGQPNDPTYARAAAEAYRAIAAAGAAERFAPKEAGHRRGNFPALAVGISYGKGQTAPRKLKNHGHSDMLQRLLENSAIRRLALYADHAFKLWSPKVYQYYQDHLGLLYEARPKLKQNFEGSAFPCATINFGPRVWTHRHHDSLNCPFGWCAIQALGDYDPKRGGHLVLWDLKLVIEFPPGSTVLIPSATFEHSNVPVASGEERASFTQYCSGGIFRWVDNGFQTEAELQLSSPQAYRRMMRLKHCRWEEGLGLLCKVDELLEPTSCI